MQRRGVRLHLGSSATSGSLTCRELRVMQRWQLGVPVSAKPWLSEGDKTLPDPCKFLLCGAPDCVLAAMLDPTTSTTVQV